MATVRTPVKGFNGTVVGVDFKDGTGETDDAAALLYFGRHGYTVEAPEVPPFPEGDPSDAWTVAQLRAFASEKGVSLGGATSKADILAALTGTPVTPPADGEQPPAE